MSVEAEANLLSAFALVIGGAFAVGIPLAVVIVWFVPDRCGPKRWTRNVIDHLRDLQLSHWLIIAGCVLVVLGSVGIVANAGKRKG